MAPLSAVLMSIPSPVEQVCDVLDAPPGQDRPILAALWTHTPSTKTAPGEFFAMYIPMQWLASLEQG